MNELLAEIRAGDEHAAMVYADLLEQRGDVPRALLIRRQWQIARLPAWSRAAIEARWEIDRLITRHGAAWRAELPQLPGVTWLEFDRGFVGSVGVVGASVLHEHAEELGAASPTLSRVVIRDLDERETPLVHAIPWLRTLCLECPDVGSTIPHAKQSLLGACSEREIVCGTENAAGFLGEDHHMKQLERLTVRGEHTGGIPLAQCIAGNTALHELRVLELGTKFVDYNYGYYGRPLDLSRNPLDAAAMAALATAPVPAELHTLKLADVELDWDAMTALSAAPWLGQLLEIDLALLPVPSELLAKLSGVRSVGLADATLDPSSEVVAAGEHAVHLDLRGADSLALLPSAAPELQTLGLAACKLTARSLARVLGGSYPHLVELDISENAFDAEMVAQLAGSALVCGLSRLVLKSVMLDDESIAVVAAQGLGPLERLDLRDVYSYTVEQMLVFARSTALREIKRIAFHGSPWQFPQPAQHELAVRFGIGWDHHDDEPVDDDEVR